MTLFSRSGATFELKKTPVLTQLRQHTLAQLMGVFVACTHASSNLVTMNTDPKLGLEIAVGNAIGWVLAGLVIGLIYKPLAG